MKVTLITTGGTINSEVGGASGIQLDRDSASRMADWFDAGFLESRDIALTVTAPFALHSEEMVPNDWLVLCRSIKEAEASGAGAVIVSHGTDTMTWSLAAVSLLLAGSSIPIVFTGARLPPAHPETDAKRHLQAAFAWASLNPEPTSYLVFSVKGQNNCYVLWGPSVTWDTNDLRLYLTRDNGELAVINNNFEIQKFGDAPTHEIGTPTLDIPHELGGTGAMFHLYPGFDPELLKSAFEKSRKKLILLNLYHSGTACTRGEYDLGPNIQRITQQGGRVVGWPIPENPEDRYVSIVSLIKKGLKPANDLTLEMAYIRELIQFSN